MLSNRDTFLRRCTWFLNLPVTFGDKALVAGRHAKMGTRRRALV